MISVTVRGVRMHFERPMDAVIILDALRYKSVATYATLQDEKKSQTLDQVIERLLAMKSEEKVKS